MTIDLLPTLAKLAGAELPKHTIDGKDIWPLLRGRDRARSRRTRRTTSTGAASCRRCGRASGSCTSRTPTAASTASRAARTASRPRTKQAKTPLALFDLEKRPRREGPTSPRSTPTWSSGCRSWPRRRARTWATRATKTDGKGVREPGKVDERRRRRRSSPTSSSCSATISVSTRSRRWATRTSARRTSTQLVKGGFAFTHAYIMGSQQAAVCVPSRAMMLTGRTLFNVGAGHPGEDADLAGDVRRGGLRDLRHRQMAQRPRLVRAFAFTKGGPVFFGGMSDQFRRRSTTSTRRASTPASRRRRRSTPASCSPTPPSSSSASTRSEKPFALYVAFTSPHDPRTAPDEVREDVRPGEAAAAEELPAASTPSTTASWRSATRSWPPGRARRRSSASTWPTITP